MRALVDAGYVCGLYANRFHNLTCICNSVRVCFGDLDVESGRELEKELPG